MFDIGWPELMILVIVAVVVVGPKDLPRLMATLGRYMARARAMAAEFQKGFEDIARDAELEDLKREIDRAGEGDILKTPPPIRPDSKIDEKSSTKSASSGSGESS
ncbi:Sec-independent protein translocase protein TatB [Pyruvatibacter sp.]|uniref:Sec-independent protein translocase protein TatB n=1 Tax=Pyruvatibacter sp. TaxID=1981328 RepID=UPI0032EC6186